MCINISRLVGPVVLLAIMSQSPVSRGETNEARFGVYGNLMAAAQYGLTVAVERGATIAPGVRIRFANAGALPYLLTGSESEFYWGGGVAPGVRFYFKQRPRALSGVYAGFWIEYYHLSGERGAYTWHMGYLAPQMEVGYRWRFKRTLLGCGVSGGPLVNVLVRHRYWNDVVLDGDKTDPLPILSVDFELGWSI